MNNVNDSKIFKAFCDPKRLYILDRLKSGEKCGCVLFREMGIGQSALSYHMKILHDAGVINCRQEGKWVHYSLNPQGIKKVATMVESYATTNIKSDDNCGCGQCHSKTL